MRRRWVLGVGAVLVACGSSSVVANNDAAAPDASSDAGVDAAVEDAGTDAATDTGTDATSTCSASDGGQPNACRFVDDPTLCEKAQCGRSVAYACADEGFPWGKDGIGGCERSRAPAPGLPYICCERKRCVRDPGDGGSNDKACADGPGGSANESYVCPSGQVPQDTTCIALGDRWCCK